MFFLRESPVHFLLSFLSFFALFVRVSFMDLREREARRLNRKLEEYEEG